MFFSLLASEWSLLGPHQEIEGILECAIVLALSEALLPPSSWLLCLVHVYPHVSMFAFVSKMKMRILNILVI